MTCAIDSDRVVFQSIVGSASYSVEQQYKMGKVLISNFMIQQMSQLKNQKKFLGEGFLF